MEHYTAESKYQYGESSVAERTLAERAEPHDALTREALAVRAQADMLECLALKADELDCPYTAQAYRNAERREREALAQKIGG
jgi:hypothetical protein